MGKKSVLIVLKVVLIDPEKSHPPSGAIPFAYRITLKSLRIPLKLTSHAGQ